MTCIAHVRQCHGSPHIVQASAEAFTVSNVTLDAITGWAGATGTYVGCMFTDYGARCFWQQRPLVMLSGFCLPDAIPKVPRPSNLHRAILCQAPYCDMGMAWA